MYIYVYVLVYMCMYILIYINTLIYKYIKIYMLLYIHIKYTYRKCMHINTASYDSLFIYISIKRSLFFFNSFVNDLVSVCLFLINTLVDNLLLFKYVQFYNTVRLC